MDGDEYTPDEGRSVPPLKIKLPVREKSKRSSSKRKGDYDESVLAADDDDFIDNSASTSSSRSKSKRSSERTKSAPPVEELPVNPTPPTRRSERIFVSATKKVSEVTEEDADEEYSNSNGTSTNNTTTTNNNNNSSSKDVIDFKIIHKDYCQSCRQGGELILCDYCPRAYHKVCVDDEINEIPDDWCCPHCTKNGKPDPKELREQQAALAAKKKKKQKDYEAKQKSAAAAAAASSSTAGTSSSKPLEFENRDYCEICNQVGELLLCDTCPRAYHLICMNMDAAPTGDWSCPYCDEHGIDSAFSEQQAGAGEEKAEKAEKIVCKSCRQQGGDIVFCATCPARYHIHCMNPPLEEVPETWHCLACSVEPLKGKVQRIITWRWKKQVQEGDAEGKSLSAEDSTKNLLKNLKNRKPREREFFCKWKDMSYWHCSWVDEGQLQVFHGGMHRNFVQKNDMNNPPVFDEGGTITTDVPHEAEVSGVGGESEEGMSEYLRGISSSNTVKHRRRKRASCLPPEVEENYVRYGIKPDWLLIHRIINHRKSRSKLFYVIKWRELAYDEVTVEAEPDNCEFPIPDYKKKVDEYWALRRTVEEEHAIENDKSSGKRKDKDDKRKSKDKKGGSGLKARGLGSAPKSDLKKKWEVQPDYIPEPLKLHEYQKEGINWLRFSWANGIDTILADEMGLGKTIQTVVFLYSLYKEGHTRGPFLIAAPLSTIINWERELEDWCPDFYTVNYTGLKESRIIIRENELSFEQDATRSSQKAMKMRKNIPVKFHVLLTSYELINTDNTLLGSIDWKVLVVDEAHRLKSSSSLFFRTLNAYSVSHKLLLTGTPLQNNLEELFNLLNFLSPNRFNDMDGFLREFSDIAKEEQVKKLHDLLGAHLLRRLKADVLSGMPAKSEFILRVDLAPQQKKYYKYILTRNFDALNSKGGGKQVSLLNIVMDLKKCCNHPYLFPVAAEEAPKTKMGYFDGGPLVKACGKLIVLQKMLRKLKNDGNRVLIFSQMTQMLDILEDFLDAEGYKFERIDGSITGSVRQEAIDRFNAPGAQQFVFLLSTRAGGLGINLATADTVVIYDSDWNPHNDIQALSRAHRIGQTNKVMIYRFVTRNSVEERITQVAKKKMMLTHLVVRPGLGSKTTNATMSKQELDDILRFGTEELFKEEEGGKESEAAIHYDDKAIEELLDRSNEGIEQKEMWADEYMSSFKVASYQTKEADEEEEEEVEEVKEVKEEPSQDPHYWEKLLGIHYIQYQDNISRTLGKGKRVRKQVNYMDHASGQHEFQNADTSESSDFSMPSDMSENDEDFDERLDGVRGNQKALRKSTKEKMPPLVSTVGANTEVLGFTPKHRKLFLDLVMRFGLPNLENSISDSQFCVRELRTKPEKHLRAYASLFISHLCEPGDPSATTFEDGVPKEGLNVGQVLTRIGIISLIRRKVFEYQLKHGTTSMKVVKQKAIAAAPAANSVEGEDDDDVVEILPKPSENGIATSGEKKASKEEEEGYDDDDVMEIPKPSENGDAQPSGEKKAKDDQKEDQKSSTAAAAKADVEDVKNDEEMEVDEQTEATAKDGEKSADVKKEDGEDVEMEDAEKKEEDTKADVKVEVKEEEETKKEKEADSKESSANATENEDSQQSQQSTAKSDEAEESSVKEDGGNTAAAASTSVAIMITSNGVEPKLAATTSADKQVIDEIVLDDDEEEEAEVTEVKEFDFIIQDGGLTELHTLWYFEEKELKPKREHEIWNRRHDYWMMAGLVKHGYEKWDDIATDEDFLIVNEPFKTSLALRNKFMERRLRLLEQALVFEEQLRRYNHLKDAEIRVEKPKEPEPAAAAAAAPVDQDVGEEEEGKDQEMKEDGADAVDGDVVQTNGDATPKEEVAAGSKKENGGVPKKLTANGGHVANTENKENEEEEEDGDNMMLNPQIQRAANQLEDLLIDMKSDCARIPQTVQRIPSIANRLQLHGTTNQNDGHGHHGHGHHSQFQSQFHGHRPQQQHHHHQQQHHPRPTVHYAGSSRGHHQQGAN